MNNINFNDGIKTYTLNNDESKVTRINTTDVNILKRLDTARKNIQDYAEQLSKVNESEATVEGMIKMLDDYDAKIRSEINSIFNSDVSSVAFGNINCTSMCGGQPLFLNFVESVIPVLEADIKAEQSGKVDKYTAQAKALTK